MRGRCYGHSRHDVAAVPFRLADAAFDTAHPYGVAVPGFGDALPDAVLVRSISAGSFEEVTRRLGVLHALRELGVPVWNDARAIERCVDKSMTSFLLAMPASPPPPPGRSRDGKPPRRSPNANVLRGPWC